MAPQSQSSYVDCGGTNCPYCNSKDIAQLDHFEADTQESWRSIYCKKCKAVWREVYKLIGYEEVFDGENLP